MKAGLYIRMLFGETKRKKLLERFRHNERMKSKLVSKNCNMRVRTFFF